MLTKLIVGIVLQYVHISNQHLVAYLKLITMSFVSYSSVKPGEGREKVCYSQFPREGACHAPQATWGNTRAGQEAKGMWGRNGLEPLFWFLLKRQGKAG